MRTYRWTAHHIRIEEVRRDGWVCLAIKDESKQSPLKLWVNPNKTEFDLGRAIPNLKQRQ
jgi:hypothetical protein